MKRTPQLVQSTPVDALAKQTLELVARSFARCGYDPAETAAAFLQASRRVPKGLGRKGTGSSVQSDQATHALTVWFNEPEFLDREGLPRPLPVHGAAPSIESLVRQIQPGPSVKEVMQYLLATKALRGVGRRYVPRERAVRHRGHPPSQSARSLRLLRGLLLNFEHNASPRHIGRSWPEYVADSPHFPLRLREAFDQRMTEDVLAFLCKKDGEMRRGEKRRRRSEPTVSLGVGFYVFESPITSGRVRDNSNEDGSPISETRPHRQK